MAAAWYQVKISQNLAPNTIKDIWRSLDKYVFPFIGNTPIDTLTARRFVEVLTPIKERGNLETLKRVLQRVNEVMDYAANSGLIDANPAMNVRKAFPSPVKNICQQSAPNSCRSLCRLYQYRQQNGRPDY